MQSKGKNPNHPKKGSQTKVEPIRDLGAIACIKENLRRSKRDRCFFILGINTAYRASELLSITCGQVQHLKPGDALSVWQPKTKKWRITVLNKSAVSSINEWLSVHPDPSPGAPLFISRTGRALKVTTVCSMVKKWCDEAGLQGSYASHSLRKTWGFHTLRHDTGAPTHMVLPLLVRAFGHTRQEQTLDYLCIQSDEVARLFMSTEL